MKYNLRRWRTGDSSSVIKLMNNIHIWGTLSDNTPFPFTKEDANSFMKRATSKCVDYDDYAITIDEEVVGGISFQRMAPPHHVVYDLSFWLNPEYRNKGIMTDALTSLLKHCFFHLPVMKVVAKVLEEDKATAAVLTKVGFRQEALLEKVILKNGNLSNLAVFSKTE